MSQIRLKYKSGRDKKRKIKKFIIGTLDEYNFGELLPYINDVNVTDINWNGQQLWIDDVTKGRYMSDITLSKDFVEAFSIRVSNVVSKSFNKYKPKLEAETDVLRITILHESVNHTGRAISIRKTPAVKRISFLESIRNGSYCSEEIANLMSNAVKAKMNIIVCGLPGVGKTELVKFLTNYIFPYDRAITIEDTLEIHYSSINPGKDCLELKVSDENSQLNGQSLFSYTDAIKASLRLLPQWILLSEARSTEVKYLLESVSTGAKCITTIHTDDVRKIPERVISMMGELEDNELIKDEIYDFFDMGILVDKYQDDETGHIERFISQICFFSKEEGKQVCALVIDKKEKTGVEIPDNILDKFYKADIIDPYSYTYLKG
jgi:pilus assembly protein CpaF